MTVRELLSEELILPRIRAARKEDVIRELAAHLAGNLSGVAPAELAAALQAREQQGSSAVGDGVAIPHGRLDALNRPIACLARSPEGIDFGAPDGRPTHLFVAVVAPSAAPSEHLRILGRIGRLFRDGELRTHLLAAETAADMARLVTQWDQR